MTSDTGQRDFLDFTNARWRGKILPIEFNDIQDAGDGNPGLQAAVKNWSKWYLHSGHMETGLDMTSYPIWNAAEISGTQVYVSDSITGSKGNFTSQLTGVNFTTTNAKITNLVQDISLGSSYDIKNVAEITGARGNFTSELTGANFKSTTANVTTIGGTNSNYTNITGSRVNLTTDLTGVKGNFTSELTGANFKSTTANITNAKITNATQDIDFGSAYDLKNVAEYTGSTMKLNAGGLNIGSITLTDGEWTQLSNIGSNVISAKDWENLATIGDAVDISSTEWDIVAALNQNLTTTSNVQFAQMTATTVVSNAVDGIDPSEHAHGGAGEGGTVSHGSLSNLDGSSDYLHSTSAEQTNWNSAYSHISANGSSHTYINQSVTTSSTPTFDGITAYGGNFVLTLDANDISSWYPLVVGDGTRDNCLKVQGGGLGSDWVVYMSDGRDGSLAPTLLDLHFTNDSELDSNNIFIRFRDSGSVVGSIHSEVTYGTFTGEHDSQTDEDPIKWKIGMIVISTGEILGEKTIGRALVKVKLSTIRKDKCACGVFSSLIKKHNFKGFDKDKPQLTINALGEGTILVTDTNGNLEIGDYIQTSDRPGLGEKQDDDLLHNYTVAKANESVNWNEVEIDEEFGYKIKMLACTYHCG